MARVRNGEQSEPILDGANIFVTTRTGAKRPLQIKMVGKTGKIIVEMNRADIKRLVDHMAEHEAASPGVYTDVTEDKDA